MHFLHQLAILKTENENEKQVNTSKNTQIRKNKGKYFQFSEIDREERPINDDRLVELLSLGQNLIKVVTIFDGLHLYNIGSSRI